MDNELNQNQIENKNNAGCIGIGFSVLFPLIGIIMYFVQKKSVANPSAYLYGAGAGVVVGLILRLIAASAQ